MPRPAFTIIFLGQEPKTKGGISWTRFRYAVQMPAKPLINPLKTNWPTSWPKINTSVASYGIAFHAVDDNRILPTHYGGKQNNKDTFWFELPADTVPPSWVYLDVKLANREYKSNQAETTL